MDRNEMSKPFDRKKQSRNERPTFAESMAEIVGVLGVLGGIILLVLGFILAITIEDERPPISPIIVKDMFPYALIIIVAAQCFINGLVFLGISHALRYLRRIAAASEE